MKFYSRTLSIAAAGVVLLNGCTRKDTVDEATAAGKSVADFPETRIDPFPGMDGHVSLTSDEIAGRNTWMMWTGGNEAFWDYMARHAYGLVDFLKVIDSRRRPERFQQLGLMNEPGYRQATEPDEFGLYLDQPISSQPDGTNPAVYGKSTGVIGFRLFLNPNFDDTARKKWDGQRYYTDVTYAQDPKLVRPYRIAMTCALCHVAFHPLYPPNDANAPEWRNLSATIGNQYMRTRGLFGTDLAKNDVLYHILGTPRPGTVETSIIATDNNNNPNIVNSIYQVAARLEVATEERMGPAAATMPPGGSPRRVPHVLVDGADSIGVAGALDRVFVNVGAFGEEWLRCHNPIVGLRTQKPFTIANARKHSVYWQATEQRTPNLAAYLVKASAPMPLRDAPGGAQYLTQDQQVLDRGRVVFAENCMACHSSKRPNDGIERRPEDYAKWAHDEKFLAWARAEVMKPDFLENNFLSTDARYPLTLLQTNASRALQDNATRGKIWEEFSSEDYKETPSIGQIEVYDPFAKRNYLFPVPGGGPGFYRVPTLVGIWAGAPFLHNNSVGEYNGDPSVDGRMRAFDSAIDQMFWPEKRPGLDTIARTPDRSWLNLRAVFLPHALEGSVGRIARPITAMPWLPPVLILFPGLGLIVAGRRRGGKLGRYLLMLLGVLFIGSALLLAPVTFFMAGKLGDLRLGPFPKGMPLNLLANMNPEAAPGDVLSAAWKMYKAVRQIEAKNPTDEEATRIFEAEAAPALLKVSKSPDWVEDRGHYFAAALSDSDKLALKEYLKTF
jgi:hypothetical protein